ncbi:hypothetical protein ABT076_10395 [Streptomyces sp. NPDC002131]|uniref:hypothetical protein n=1 Tax=Streptomyces sp. NPDC002131 TaxID=3154535 RepID=UPI003333E641
MDAGMDDESRAAACEWARANGLDPSMIHEWTKVVGDTIHYRELVGRDPGGNAIWADRRSPMLVDFPVGEYRLSTR